MAMTSFVLQRDRLTRHGLLRRAIIEPVKMSEVCLAAACAERVWCRGTLSTSAEDASSSIEVSW